MIMKKIILIFTAILLVQCVNAQKKQNGWQMYNLKNKVKSYTQVTYKVIKDSDTITKGKKLFNISSCFLNKDTTKTKFEKEELKLGVSSIKFNRKGNITEKSFYNPNTNSGVKITFIYNDAGKLIEHNSSDYKTNKLHDKTIHKYDEFGKEIECKTFNSNNVLVFKNIYKYDQNGNKIEMKMLDKNILMEKQTFLYDDKSNQVQKNIYDGENLHRKETYKYDKDGYKYKKIEFYDKNGNCRDRFIVKTYDTKNRLIEDCDYSSKNIMTNIELYKYNGNNDVIEYKAKSATAMMDFNTMKSRQMINFRNITTFTYTYDLNGNWIKTIKYVNGKAKEVVERNIEYYE